MLTPQEIEAELFRSADKFLLLVKQKEYLKAKRCYKKAMDVANMVQLEQDKMDKLFGSRQVDPMIEGAFPEKMVLKVMEMCFSIEKESEETEAQLRQIQQKRKSGRQVLEERRQKFLQSQNRGAQRIEELRKEWQ